MATKQIIAYGATVERSTDGNTYTNVPECKGIAIPTVETEYVDVTNLDSPNGYREYLSGLKDAGVISVPCGYTHAGYAVHLADQATGLPIYYRVTLRPAPDQSTGDVFIFTGYPTPQVEANDVAGAVEMTLEIRTTGAPSWTAGS